MLSSTVTALLGLGTAVYAASNVNKQCPGSSICYSVNVPDTTASSGSGDVFFQITAPTSNSWVGMGTGSSMARSNMFIIYTSSNGQNITLSPRTAQGNSMPQFSSSLQATLLDGSGVSNGVMTANIKCSNCNSKQQNWIWGARSGSPLNSDSQSATISQHTSSYGTFNFDLAKAQGGSNQNPFTAAGTSTSGTSGGATGCRQNSGSGTSTGSAAASSSGFFNFPPWGSRPSGTPSSGSGGGYKDRRAANDDNCNDGTGLSQTGKVGAYSKEQIKLIAHGVMAGTAFAVFFPFGAIAIRLFSFPGLVNFHAIFQVLALVTYIIAFVLGITIANDLGYMYKAHPLIGIVLMVMLVIQPILGHMHHRMFAKLKTRTFWSHGHLWLGRALITLGIINGGLGFALANNSKYGPIVYGIVAGIMWLAYVASTVIGERRRAKRITEQPPKYIDRSRISPPTADYYGHNRRY